MRPKLARLQSWQNQQAAENAAKAEAKEQRLEELQKQKNFELKRRNVQALERQAISSQQQQQILEERVPTQPSVFMRPPVSKKA